MKTIEILLALVALIYYSEAKITVSVYYETLCPDSKRFITTQLTPTFVQLGGLGNAYLDIDFVPYGKALTFENDGEFTFQCQHGPAECEGNRVHSCALKHLPAASHAAFINCTMSASSPPTAGPACANLLGLDLSLVDRCAAGAEGNNLLAVNGNRTHSLQPTLYYVPWILFDGVFSTADLADAQSNFLELLCRKIGSNGPAICPQATQKTPITSENSGAETNTKGLVNFGIPSIVATLLNSRR